MSNNPYEVPNAPVDNAPPPVVGGSQYQPCPKCKTPDPKMPGFTWWGGVVGPKMFKHVKCTSCGYGYNGMTGESNTTKIVVYQAVVLVIVVGIYIALGV